MRPTAVEVCSGIGMMANAIAAAGSANEQPVSIGGAVNPAVAIMACELAMSERTVQRIETAQTKLRPPQERRVREMIAAERLGITDAAHD